MDTEQAIDAIIELALAEDGQDVTSTSIFKPADKLKAVIKVKEPGVIAGLSVAAKVFKRMNPDIEYKPCVMDGASVAAGDIVARIQGPASDVLKAERVVLNFMQRMSGIATTTAAYVKQVKGTKAKVMDTRKTVPGLRVLDKLAVKAAGGLNHRMGLFDLALIKDNHIDNCGSIATAIARIRAVCPEMPIEVESRNLDEVREILKYDVYRIMLDNFTLEQTREAVELVNGRVPLEASGGITLKTIREVALTGVDYISVGDLTHSVRALDITMLIEAV